MDEYKFLKEILSNERGFVPEKQDLMCEGEIQKTRILSHGRGLNDYTLYRFDTSEKDFLPFFNKTDNAPKYLRSFCDYIILAEIRNKLFILLIELKSGDASHAHVQLEASYSFINFIINTAQRIKDINGYSEKLDVKNIEVRRITVKNVSQRPQTKVNKGYNVKRSNNNYIYKSKIFDISYICQRNL